MKKLSISILVIALLLASTNGFAVSGGGTGTDVSGGGTGTDVSGGGTGTDVSGGGTGTDVSGGGTGTDVSGGGTGTDSYGSAFSINTDASQTLKNMYQCVVKRNCAGLSSKQ